MAKPEAAAASPPRAESRQPTHLVGRTRGSRPTFNRAGLQFDQEFKAIPLDTLTEEQVARVLAEPMLEARVCTEREAAELTKARRVDFDADVPKHVLVTMVEQLTRKLETATARIEKLEAAQLVDRPPSTSDQLRRT